MFGDNVYAKIIGTLVTLLVIFGALGWAFDRALTIAGYPR